MTHTIKDILREGIEEFRKEIGEVPNGDAFLLENFQTGDKMCITCGHPANPNTRIEQLADWLKAHDQKLLQAVIDTARGMKKSEHEEPHEMADQKRWDLW